MEGINMTECNKIIHKVAMEMLKPVGFVQLGSSRFYAKDYGYFLILVTYVPMNSVEGSYIDVFISYYFDYGYDEAFLFNDYHLSFLDEELNKCFSIYNKNEPKKFENEIKNFTEIALKAIAIYCKFEKMEYALEKYKSYSEPTLFWYYYKYGLLLLLFGHYDEGIEYLKKTVVELKDPTLPYKIVPILRKKIENDLAEKYTSKEKSQEEMVNMVNNMRCRLASESRYKRLKLERPFVLEEKYK